MPITQERLIGIVGIAEHYQMLLEEAKKQIIETITLCGVGADVLPVIERQLETISQTLDLPLPYVRTLTKERTYYELSVTKNFNRKRLMENGRRAKGVVPKHKDHPFAVAPGPVSLDFSESEGGAQIDPSKGIF